MNHQQFLFFIFMYEETNYYYKEIQLNKQESAKRKLYLNKNPFYIVTILHFGPPLGWGGIEYPSPSYATAGRKRRPEGAPRDHI
jgi:hypothetical protein